MSDTNGGSQARSGWWMYHGDPHHTGFVTDSDLDAATVGSQAFGVLHELQLGGPILSVPAVVDGFVYVGVANYHQAEDGNGGALHKVDIQKGEVVKTFVWSVGDNDYDAHGFAGMGCTPMVVKERVYFGAFDGKVYCLNQETLEEEWQTDLRNADPSHNQPVTNVGGVKSDGNPAAVIWTSPVVSSDGTKLYVACGEGENPDLFSFVFCLDTESGDVVWIYCTNQYRLHEHNTPNVLPPSAVGKGPPPAPFSTSKEDPVVMGCSVWGAIAYDEDSHRIYCPTGNQQLEPNRDWKQVGDPWHKELPSPGVSNGMLSLCAETGEYRAFFQILPESNYRETDWDVDVASAPVITRLGEQKVAILTAKNGGLFVLDADTLALIKWRQMLPYDNQGKQIPGVDARVLNAIDNETSNERPGENYSGVFNTTAVYPGSADETISPRLFVAIGGPNYHAASPGIYYKATPFMRAIEFDSADLVDAWPMDTTTDPHRYLNCSHRNEATGEAVGMYTSAGESGLSSPAVVNDVVFCTTSKVAIYAFDVRDGKLLWWDRLGDQTRGMNGGYGYCLGAAIWKNYVVAGALVKGRDGGVLRIYGLKEERST